MSDYLFLKLDNITACNSALLGVHNPLLYRSSGGDVNDLLCASKISILVHLANGVVCQCSLVNELSEGIDLSYRIDKSLSFLKIMLALLAYVHFL